MVMPEQPRTAAPKHIAYWLANWQSDTHACALQVKAERRHKAPVFKAAHGSFASRLYVCVHAGSLRHDLLASLLPHFMISCI